MGSNASINGVWWIYFTVFFILILVKIVVKKMFFCFVFLKNIFLFLFLQVLEACMKNCGRRFHNEVGKFKFLNELIKVVSPKVSTKCFTFADNIIL